MINQVQLVAAWKQVRGSYLVCARSHCESQSLHGFAKDDREARYRHNVCELRSMGSRAGFRLKLGCLLELSALRDDAGSSSNEPAAASRRTMTLQALSPTTRCLKWLVSNRHSRGTFSHQQTHRRGSVVPTRCAQKVKERHLSNCFRRPWRAAHLYT